MAKIVMSAQLKYNDAELRKLTSKIGVMPLTAILATTMEATFIPAIRRKIRQDNLVYTGNLFRNLVVRPAPMSGIAAVDVGTFGVNYGLPLELGGKAREVPFQAILRWVEKKLRPPNPYAVARIIQRNIAKDGTKERPFILPTFNSVRLLMVEDYQRRVRAYLGT